MQWAGMVKLMEKTKSVVMVMMKMQVMMMVTRLDVSVVVTELREGGVERRLVTSAEGGNGGERGVEGVKD